MIRTKQLQIKKDMTLEIDMQKHPVLDFSITVAAGKQLNLVWLGNDLNKTARPSINFILHEKARLHLALAVSRSHDASVKASIGLVGNGAEAYVSGIFHGFGADRHSLDVAIHHQARDTKGDILIKGIYEDTAYGKFNGLLKVHPGANRTNSYFTDNILLFGRGMATSIPTLEILANDVRASHSSTTSRADADQLFYLQSRGLPHRQAIRQIIQGFFHPVLARLPQNTVKLFPYNL
jgi:Fe-S cluster assembly protein SufD